jgi:hypothetical protein
MGIDIRTGRSQMYDRNKYYKADYVDNMKLSQNAVALGVFYSTDLIPLEVQKVVNGNVMSKQYVITIVTHDIVSDLEINDYVLYAGSDLYRVDSIISEDVNDQKRFSARPSFKTTIRLVR